MEFKQITQISSDLGKGLAARCTAKFKTNSILSFPSSPKGEKAQAVQQGHADTAACDVSSSCFSVFPLPRA